MTFWQIFARVAPWHPFAAMKSLWWHVTGRKLRARNRLRTFAAPFPFAYEFWIREIERGEYLKREADTAPATWPRQPNFSLVLSVGDADCAEDAQRTIRSIQQQLYPNWTLLIITRESGLSLSVADENRIQICESLSEAGCSLPRIALMRGSGDFFVPVRPGDLLAPWGLYRMAEAIQTHPDAAILYGDHDELDSLGRRTKPWFKPRWNEEMFFAQDYLSDAVAVRADLARAATAGLPPNASLYAVLLAASRNPGGPIVHVSHILAHVQPKDRQTDQDCRMEAVGRALAPEGASVCPGPFGTVKVTWPLPAKLPLVSILIPTKDKLEFLKPCVESVLERTSYGNFEILIIDNASSRKRTLKYLEEVGENPKVRVLRYEKPYNFSAINNYAAQEASGSYLCMLNNDTEVIGAHWLEELMRYAVRPGIGAVGAKLLYPDRTIQHAGVAVGVGNAAGHVHRNLPDSEPGYFSQPHVTQFTSAVTGACLLVSKTKFIDVGGFDEADLAVAYNDVDLCLKLERAGYRNAYVPHAVLIHHESKSRAKDHSRSQIDRYRRELKTFQDRWQACTYKDPMLNPHLDRSSETFLIRL